MLRVNNFIDIDLNQAPESCIGFSKGPVNNATVAPWPFNWEEYKEKMRKPELGDKDGSYFSCLAFTNNHRSNANAQGQVAPMFVLDGDSTLDSATGKTSDGAPDPLRVHEVLVKRGITHIIYSSHSNGKKGNRYRVVILAQWSGKDELTGHVMWIIHLLHEAGVMLANVSENTDIAHLWFMPRVPDQTHANLFEFYEHDDGQEFPKDVAEAWWESEGRAAALAAKKGKPASDALIVGKGGSTSASMDTETDIFGFMVERCHEKAPIEKVKNALANKVVRWRKEAGVAKGSPVGPDFYARWQRTTMMVHNWDPSERGFKVALKFGEFLGYSMVEERDKLRDKWRGYDK